MRYFLHLSYNGSKFCGWQIQPNEPSVQESLETAFFHLLKEKIGITGCGRTDTGVHAKSYYAHFDFRELSNKEIEDLVFKLNRYFGFGIRILNIFRMKPEAHARFDAGSRTYKYYIANQKQPFNNDFSYYYPRVLNIEKMNQACQKLREYTDFTSFSKLHTQVNNNNCTIISAFWEREGDDIIVFTIEANRFLRNMVRSIVGTLIEVGFERICIEEFCKIIEAKDRNRAGVSVPAKALFLYNIKYEKELFFQI
ncbi:MAG: tRNA pseudouridine(38-40) synthase TruA [Bacteroidales bacterium]|nr:tRNA pseudouridine(38-40) synthase TruA [Bacteroidales bacterium]